MELTIDHIASGIMCWCANDSSSFKDYWYQQDGWKRKALNDLIELFNKETDNVLVIDQQETIDSSANVDMLFNYKTVNPDKRILAGLVCEGQGSNDLYRTKIEDEIKKLEELNFTNENKQAAKYLISMYHNLNTRRYLREKDFIEIFNNMEIGCAIKRIK